MCTRGIKHLHNVQVGIINIHNNIRTMSIKIYIMYKCKGIKNLHTQWHYIIILCYTLVHRYIVTITVTTVIISISEFLWLSVVEDEDACGVGDVMKVLDGGGVSAA